VATAWWHPLPPGASEPSTNVRSSTRTVFDAVALPSETPFITAARASGVDVISGAEVIALSGGLDPGWWRQAACAV